MSSKKRHSLFAKIFTSIMAIVIIIIVVQTAVVAIMFSIQSKQFKNEVFSSFRENLEQTFSLSGEAGTLWDLSSIGPALLMASDDRINAFVIRDKDGDVISTIIQQAGKPKGIGQLPYPTKESFEGAVAGSIALYDDKEEANLVGFVDVIVYSPLNYYLTALLLWRMVISFGITIPLALIIALIGSRIVAASVARNASKIATTLQLVADGSYLKEEKVSSMVELKQISDAVSELSKQLKSHEKLRQQWIRSIAHDLNTPIAALKITIEGTLDGVLPLDGQTLTQMRDELEILRKRVESVLILSTLESPDFKLKNQQFDSFDFVDEALSSSSLEGEVEVEIKKSKLVGERSLLLLALRELLKNSDKYKEKGSTIVLRIAGDEENIIEVSNKGNLNSTEVERVFDMFYRFDESRTLAGSGLGLSIVKQIMEAHNGQAKMASDQKDITVTLLWPSS